jgi:hypothetical protein
MNNGMPTEFIIDKKYEFFTALDISSTFLGLAVILILAYIKQNRNKDLDYYRYYMPAILFKVAFVAANCSFYIFVYGAGGDSIGFWDGAVKLNNLFWHDPLAYFSELWRTDDARTVYEHFNVETGYPDTRIYGERESFFISKLASVITFVSFKGYLLMSLIVAFITTNASMRLYELVRSFGLHSDWHIALAVFFVPSLSFWCGGISKDTIMWISVCYFLHHIYQLISLEKKSSFLNWLGVVVFLYIMWQVRSFMVVTALAPLLFAYGSRLRKKFGPGSMQSRLASFLILIIVSTGIFIFLNSSFSQDLLKEAEVINKDMTTNKTYGSNRYDLGITDYSTIGMLKAAPASIFAGVYRPLIWESLSISLFLNGIESLVLIFFTLRFAFAKGFKERVATVRDNEFLIYAFVFALILAYFAGFTSILFGVLVRFKAPVLPFLVLIFTAVKRNENELSQQIQDGPV